MKNLSFKIFLFIALVIFSSCTIKKFEAPEWDIELAVPLINETYYMKDIADSTEDYIIAVVNDTMEFSISQDLDTTRVEDELKVDGQEKTFEEEIGDELKLEDHHETFSVDVGDSLKLDGRSDSFSTEIGDKLEVGSREDAFSVDVGDSLKIKEQSRAFSNQLERIEVEETGESYASVGVLEFARSAIPGVGEIYNHTLPPIYNFPPIDTNFTIFENDNIEYVVIDSGWAYIDFTNSTEMPLSSNDPQHYMNIEIYGEEIIPENLILTHYIDHVIPGGATENIVLDLSGCKVYRYNFLRVNLTTDGTGATPIDVLEADKFIVILSVSEMTVSEASAKLPAEHIIHNDAISIEDNDVQIIYAKIDSCLGNVRIDNYLPIEALATIDFVELRDEVGEPLHVEFHINLSPPPNNYPLDLAGYQIISTSKDILDSLHFTYKIDTYPTENFVNINTTQYVDCRVEFGTMWFEEVSGYVNQAFSKDDDLSIADDTGEIILEDALIKSGNLSIELSGLDFTPEISIQFDEIRLPPDYIHPVVITNDDFVGYDFSGHKFVIAPDQLVHYHINVQMPGQSELITVDNSDKVNAVINLSHFIFEQVTGTLENKSFSDNEAISIVDETGEISLQYAKIKSADNSYIFFHNDFPFDMSGTVTFQELKAPAPLGGPFTFDFSIPANQTYQEDLDLVNCTIESGKSIDSLHYFFDVTLSGTGSINYTDSVYAEFNLGEMYFDEVSGYINKNFTKEGSISVEDSTITLKDATIRSGNLHVTLSGIALVPPDTVKITIYDILTPEGFPVEILITDNFHSFEYDFANHRIVPVPDSLTLNYFADVKIHQDLTISSTDVVTADIELQDLIFDEVTGEFESFTFEGTDASVVDESGEFDLFYAEIDSCDVQISIEALKSFPLEADITIKFDEIFKDNGDTLKITIHCPGDTLLSFAGYTIGDDPTSTTEIDSLHYSYDVVTLATDVPTTIRYEDKVKATITLGDMAFNKVVGTINNKRIDLDNIEEDFDIGDMPDSLEDVLQFQNAEMVMTINNGINLGCTINARITGTNRKTGESSMILIDHEYLAPNAVTEICKNVSDFLNILPDSIYADSMYVIMNGQGTICKTDSVFGSYIIRTPFEFIIENHNIKMDSLQHIEIDKDARDKIENNLNLVHVCLTAENKFPFGATARLCFAADSTQVWENPELVIDSLTFEPATIDTLHHVSGDKTVSHLIIELYDAQGDFSVFTHEDIYLGIEFGIIGTKGQVVTIRGSDNMKIYGSIKVGVHIDESLWED
ncbi:MAG: hypothetical protein KAW92_08805 [Candidatus Cloacimonetes bacterium]|nr:hypothetical protein [Candidatus Cloacimonadota bacterium]